MSVSSMLQHMCSLDETTTNNYRQQRKRRAGMSSGPTLVAQNSAGGRECSSAGERMSNGFPALGGRSPQSSFDSNQDVAQISMNFMRMNGLGTSMRPLLTTSPKCSQSQTYLVRVPSSKKVQANLSLEEDSLTLHYDSHFPGSGENASRKSVSIAYSNDFEAQKTGGLLGSGIANPVGGDDSQSPLVENDEGNNSGGRLIKREILHDRRRLVCDRALAFSILGILLMVFESELRSSNIILSGSVWSLLLKCIMLLSTSVLLIFVGLFHVIEIQLFMNANAADDWRVSVTTRRACQVAVEMFICALQPMPLEMGTWYRDDAAAKGLHTMNMFLSICMFLRLYWGCRVMLLHSRLFTDASSRSIAGLNRVNFNARFILKTLMTICPGKMLMLFTASLWVIAGFILRLCEREYLNVDERKDMDYLNSIWLVAITFLSIGYGDIVPHTNCGRLMAVITGILGTCASSMVVAVIARKLELTRAEKHVHNFMMDTQLTKQLKHSAANVLRETWFIYKYRKLSEKVDFTKIRMHQRKFLVAIYEMRRVKREQRKLAENLVSLGDVAKTSSNTYELVHDVHSTQEGLCLRVTAIEHQLTDISRELSVLAELLRSSRRHSLAACDAEGDGLVMRRSLPRKYTGDVTPS